MIELDFEKHTASIIEKVICDVKEKQDQIIMQKIEKIGGEEYRHITIDKNKVIAAFKKQMPQKPDYEADGYADGVLCYDYAKCPICGHDFEYGVNDWGCNYCQDCGQALDWSDTE